MYLTRRVQMTARGGLYYLPMDLLWRCDLLFRPSCTDVTFLNFKRNQTSSQKRSRRGEKWGAWQKHQGVEQFNMFCFLGVFQCPPTLMLRQSIAIQMGAVSWFEFVACVYHFQPRGGHTLQKHRDRNGRCIVILFSFQEHQELLSFVAAVSYCAPKLPEPRSESFLFHGSWNLSRTFRKISCGHFSWKLKDENRRSFSPNFRHIFRPCRRKVSPEFRSWGFSA